MQLKPLKGPNTLGKALTVPGVISKHKKIEYFQAQVWS